MISVFAGDDLFRKQIGRHQAALCKKFLLKNDYTQKKEQRNGYDVFIRSDDCLVIDINDKEIVLIDDSGDFYRFRPNYFHLIGVLIELNLIDLGYISIYSK